jgi:hypothetical protein
MMRPSVLAAATTLAAGLVLAIIGCQGFKDYLANPTGLPPTPASPGENAMYRDFKKQDGYKIVEVGELGADVRGQRVKTCGKPQILGTPPSDQTDVEAVDRFKAQHKVPPDRGYLLAPTAMGKRVFVSVPAAEHKALWDDLAGSGEACFWFDGEVQDLEAPEKVRSFQKWFHVPVTKWDGPSKPHAPEPSPAASASSAPAATP